MDTEPQEFEDEALEQEDGELLPDREQMSVIDLGEGGGLAPPPMDADPEGVETPPIIENPPPTE